MNEMRPSRLQFIRMHRECGIRKQKRLLNLATADT